MKSLQRISLNFYIYDVTICRVEYFKDINASGNYLLGLINDILDMSRIEQGKMDIVNKYEEAEEIIINCFLK